jgi:hypothetical protein
VDIKDLREQWKRKAIQGLYSAEQTDWRRFRDRKASERPRDEPDIDERDWYSHALLAAMQGSGKTNILRWRIEQLLPLIAEGRVSLILLDPKDVLTRELPTLARTLGLADRTILIDPLNAPVSVNLFDKGDGSPYALSEAVGRLSRILDTVTANLSPFQRDMLSLAVSALFAISDTPSLDDLFPILRKGKEILPLDQLSSEIRDIFGHDYRTNEAHFIVSRLNRFRTNPYFKPIFDPKVPSIDLAHEIQQGKLILIKSGIKEPLYGRIWIEQIDRVIDSRFELPEHERVPTFVIIDEAQIFISRDEHFADIIDRAREAKIGMLIACQHMNQIQDPHVKTSLYNCAIKLVSRTNGDVHDFARAMGGIETKRFGSIPRYHFLFYTPDMTEPDLIKFPVVTFPAPKREDTLFFIHRHTQRQSVPLEVQPRAPLLPVVAPAALAGFMEAIPKKSDGEVQQIRDETPPVRPGQIQDRTQPSETQEIRPAAGHPYTERNALEHDSAHDSEGATDWS